MQLAGDPLPGVPVAQREGAEGAGLEDFRAVPRARSRRISESIASRRPSIEAMRARCTSASSFSGSSASTRSKAVRGLRRPTGRGGDWSERGADPAAAAPRRRRGGRPPPGGRAARRRPSRPTGARRARPPAGGRDPRAGCRSGQPSRRPAGRDCPGPPTRRRCSAGSRRGRRTESRLNRGAERLLGGDVAARSQLALAGEIALERVERPGGIGGDAGEAIAGLGWPAASSSVVSRSTRSNSSERLALDGGERYRPVTPRVVVQGRAHVQPATALQHVPQNGRPAPNRAAVSRACVGARRVRFASRSRSTCGSTRGSRPRLPGCSSAGPPYPLPRYCTPGRPRP